MAFQNKYDPKTLDDLVIEPRNKRILEQLVRKEITDHLLIEGTNGTGKTTVTELLPSLTHGNSYDILDVTGHKDFVIDSQTLYAWDNFITFCRVQGNAAHIVINEIDKIERNLPLFWQWLDSRRESVTVLGTTNRLMAVEKAMRSRMNCLSFGPVTATQMLPRAMEILTLEGLNASSDFVFRELAKVESLGDIRKYMQRLEQIALALRTQDDEGAPQATNALLYRVK